MGGGWGHKTRGSTKNNKSGCFWSFGRLGRRGRGAGVGKGVGKGAGWVGGGKRVGKGVGGGGLGKGRKVGVGGLGGAGFG